MTALPRSWLFTPGSRPDRFSKAAATAAEALILDLEDAVAEDGKAQARDNVLHFLADRGVVQQQICVRINPLDRAIGLADLSAVALAARGPELVMIPKAEQPAELALAGRVLAEAGSSVRIVALIESARGVAAAAELAQASPHMGALLFGAADYAANMGQQVGRYRPDFARAAIVNAAAAGGIVAIDSPFFAIDRPDDLAIECAAGRVLGFHGKAAIHPAQVEPINSAYQPDEAERDLARRIIEAAPDGVGVLDGKMIDVAMVRWAQRIV